MKASFSRGKTGFRLASLCAALFVVIGTVRMASASDSAADQDWKAYEEAFDAKPLQPLADMSRLAVADYYEKRALRLRELGLAFIEQHPDDPRRWYIVDRFYGGAPRFVKEWGPVDETGLPGNPVVDEAAAAAWAARVAELRAEMTKATDVPESLRKEWAQRAERTKEANARRDAFFARWRSGEMAPDFMARDMAGRDVKLSDFRGKVVVLDFWATWCGPCKNAMPHTQQVAAQYKDQGVVVIASCTDDTRARFESWVKANGDRYPDIVWTCDPAEKGDDRASKRLYDVTGIPTQFVIDRTGRVVDFVYGYLKGDVILDAALSKAGVRVDSDLVSKGLAQREKRGF